MNNQTSIKHISSLLDSPNTITDGDQSSIALFRQTFPFFVPIRYLAALESHKKSPYTPQMLAAMQPYMGNWILFCDFLKAGTSKLPEQEVSVVPVLVVDEKIRALGEVIEEKKEINPVSQEEKPREVKIEEAAPLVFDPSSNLTGTTPNNAEQEEPLVFPVYTNDYFLQQGEKIPEDIPLEINELKNTGAMSEEDKSLMVVMSFSEWLLHFKNSAIQQQEETKDRKALKTLWQKEKLAAAMEEENEEIPENVFNMAVNSISMEDGLISETLAEIYIKQGKYDNAIEMYRKLSLQNPQKNAYFARKIEEALKDKQS